MDITILKNPEKFLFDNRLRWELFAKKSRGAIIVIGLCGIVILVIAWIYAKEGENFWGPVSSIGLSFILLCLIYFFQLYQNKQKFLRETSVYVSKLKKLGSETVIKINEIMSHTETVRDFWNINGVFFRSTDCTRTTCF